MKSSAFNHSSQKQYHPPKQRQDEDGSWQTSFLDIFVLLLAFFVILAGLARFDIILFDDTALALRSDLMGTERIRTPILELKYDLEQILETELEEESVALSSHLEEIRLEFRDATFYRTASADLLPQGKEVINQIMDVLETLYFYQFHIDVEGHTDSRPISTMRFPSNWELSTARASNIIKYFIEQGFNPSHLKASGYADAHPLVPDYDADGNPIPENMAINRRVVIRIHY